ncbi:DUF2384 domain-containing protein [Thalassomonas sp. M1454]|nr:DUF2384 domain-containing protein [Thalassomonas sp. M1454]
MVGFAFSADLLIEFHNVCHEHGLEHSIACALLNLTKNEFDAQLKASAPTHPRTVNRLLRCLEIFNRLYQLNYVEAHHKAHWLRSAHNKLDARPIELMCTDLGSCKVLKYLINEADLS